MKWMLAVLLWITLSIPVFSQEDTSTIKMYTISEPSPSHWSTRLSFTDESKKMWMEFRISDPVVQRVELLVDSGIIMGYRKTDYWRLIYSNNRKYEGSEWENNRSFYYDEGLTKEVKETIYAYRVIYDITLNRYLLKRN